MANPSGASFDPPDPPEPPGGLHPDWWKPFCNPIYRPAINPDDDQVDQEHLLKMAYTPSLANLPDYAILAAIGAAMARLNECTSRAQVLEIVAEELGKCMKARYPQFDLEQWNNKVKGQQ